MKGNDSDDELLNASGDEASDMSDDDSDHGKSKGRKQKVAKTVAAATLPVNATQPVSKEKEAEVMAVFEGMMMKDLKTELKGRGAVVGGTRPELLQRLRELLLGTYSFNNRGKPKLKTTPLPILDEAGNVILISKGQGGDAVIKTTATPRKSVGGAPGEDGVGSDDVIVTLEEEDVDSADVGTDGTMWRDERGTIEVGLPAVAATLTFGDNPPQFPVPTPRITEVSEREIPAIFNAPESGDGSLCRILDNFFLCDADGNAVGLDVLDDKERLGRGIQAFGTVVAYPRSKGEVDSVPARIRVLMDALAFMESQATGAGSGSVGAGAVQSKPAGPLVHRPQALPALGPDAELSREQAYQRAKTLTADMKLPFRANSAVTVQDLGVIKPAQGYYNDRYIWPVGFKSSRMYNSYVNVDSRVEYVSEILDGGDSGPVFKVTAVDDPENPAVATAASSAWQTIMKRVHKAKSDAGQRTRDALSVSGPEFYGYSSDVCSQYIEGLEGSLACSTYVFREQRPNTKSGRSSATPGEAADSKKRPRQEASSDESAGEASASGDDEVEDAPPPAPLETKPLDLKAAVSQACHEMGEQISLKEVRQRAEQLMGKPLLDQKDTIKTMVSEIVENRNKPQSAGVAPPVPSPPPKPVGSVVPVPQPAPVPRAPAVMTFSGRLSQRPVGGYSGRDSRTPGKPLSKEDALEQCWHVMTNGGRHVLFGAEGEQRQRLRVHLSAVKDWCIDYSNEAPMLWIETDVAWYMVGGYTNLSSPAATYKTIFRPYQMKFEACVMIARTLSDLIPRNRNLSYRAVLVEVQHRTGFFARNYREVAKLRRTNLDLLLHGSSEEPAGEKPATAESETGLDAGVPAKLKRPFPVVYASGKTITEMFLLENAKFVTEQMAGIPDKAALFENCKFLTQLKTRGTKHFEKVLRVKSKSTSKETRDVVKVERIKGVSIGDDMVVIDEDLEMGKVVLPIPEPNQLFAGLSSSLAADLTSLWMFYQLYAEALRLAVFSLDEFAHAVLYTGGDCSLITQCILGTFRVLLREEKRKARRAANDPANAVIFDRPKEKSSTEIDEDDKARAAEAVASRRDDAEEALLTVARQVGLDDELNAGNWQELLRWYLCSKLDSVSLAELNAKLAALKAGNAPVAPLAAPVKPENEPVKQEKVDGASSDSDEDMTGAEDQARRRNNAEKLQREAAAIAAEDAGVSAGLSSRLQQCYQVLKGIMRCREAQAAFNEPVDPVERDFPTYNYVVKHPMDLGTVKERLLSGYYNSENGTCDEDVPTTSDARPSTRGQGEAGFVADVRLVFDNVELYAQPELSVFKMAKKLRGQFLSDYRRIVGDVPGMTADELAVEALTSGLAKGYAGDIELAFQLGQTSFARYTPELKVLVLRWLADAVNDTATIRAYQDTFPQRAANVSKDIRRLEADVSKKTEEYEKAKRSKAQAADADAAQKLSELEQLNLELAQLKAKVSVFNVTSHSIGYDRHHRRYWSFAAAGGVVGAARLFVEDPDSHQLLCYDTADALTKLIDALNKRGVRELALHTRLSEVISTVKGQVKQRDAREAQYLQNVLEYAGRALLALKSAAASPRTSSCVAGYYESDIRAELTIVPQSPLSLSLLTAASLSVPNPRQLLNMLPQDVSAIKDETNCMHCGVPFSGGPTVKGRDEDLLCKLCGVYWATYKEYRPLTARQLWVAKTRADERSGATAATLVEKLTESQQGPVTAGSLGALRLAASDTMMRCVVCVPQDDKTVLSLPLPPLPHFAYYPVSQHLTNQLLRSKLFGSDTPTLLAGLPFAAFSTQVAVKAALLMLDAQLAHPEAMPFWGATDAHVQWRLAVASQPGFGTTVDEWSAAVNHVKSVSQSLTSSRSRIPLTNDGLFGMIPGQTTPVSPRPDELAVVTVLKTALLQLEARFVVEAAGTGVLIPAWKDINGLWRLAVQSCRTLSQLCLLICQFREKGVDWDVLTVSPSELDRRQWLKIEKFQGPVSAGGAGATPFSRSFVPEVGARIVYFGTGHRQAAATALVQVKRAISALKKSLDSRRRRERERQDREKEREVEKAHEIKMIQESVEKGQPAEEFVSQFLPEEDGGAGEGEAEDVEDDGLDQYDDYGLDDEGQPKKKKKPVGATKRPKATPKKTPAKSKKAAAAAAEASEHVVPMEDIGGFGDDDDDEFAVEDDLLSPNRKPTASELLSRSKPRDGVARCEVVDLTYHQDRNGDPYCRIKLRVTEWFAGVGGGGATSSVKAVDAKPVPTIRVPSLCLIRDTCTVCADGGDLIRCDYHRCTNAFHPQCVGLATSAVQSPWYCPSHSCKHCGEVLTPNLPCASTPLGVSMDPDSSNIAAQCGGCTTSYCKPCFFGGKVNRVGTLPPQRFGAWLCAACSEPKKLFPSLLKRVFAAMRNHPDASSFSQPVSLREYPDYIHFVTNPMDLSMLWKRINGEGMPSHGDYRGYTSITAFKADMNLIASNCELFCRDRYPSMPPAAKRVVTAGVEAIDDMHSELVHAEAMLRHAIEGTKPTADEFASGSGPSDVAPSDAASASTAAKYTPEQIADAEKQLFALRDAAKVRAYTDADAELSSNADVLEHLHSVTERVVSSQMTQWTALAAKIGVNLTPETAAAARARFLEAAAQQARVAFKESRAAAAVGAAVSTLPLSVTEVLGGPSGVTALLSGEVVGTTHSAVVETFTVTLPLHSMSPDFIIPEEKYRGTAGRKFDKGERFRMQFEDGNYYYGSIVGCVDCVVPGEEPVRGRCQEIGAPWESLLVRWDDGDKQVNRLNPWEIHGIPGARPKRPSMA